MIHKDETVRNDIIFKLIYHPSLSFSQLWDKKIESNKFAYHLKKLQSEKLILKKNNQYYLTKKAKEGIDWIANTGEKIMYPAVCYLYLITNERNKILVFQKLKEPFYGYFGLPAGRMRFGSKIIESARENFRIKTNLNVSLKLIGIYNIRTFNFENQPYHQIMFLLRGTNPKGDLISDLPQGKLKWVTLKKILKLKLFPETRKFLKLRNIDNFEVREIERVEKNNKIILSKFYESLL